MLTRFAIITLLLVTTLTAASDPDTEVRREFRQAWVSLDSAANTDSAALRGYVLYPYLQAARLQHALTQAGHDSALLDQQIKAFLTAQQGLPVVRELRRSWLLDLATRQQWSEFLVHLPADTSDVELKCWQASAMLAVAPDSEQRALLDQLIPKLWLSGNHLPAACNAPFDWGRGHGVITATLIEQRARLVLKAGDTEFARELALNLTEKQAEPIKQWAILIEKPQQAFDALIANPGIKVEDAILQDGWSRFVRKDVDAALTRFSAFIKSRGFAPEAASPYAQSLALSLSWSRRSEALGYFAQVLATDKTDQGHEWHARAALWAGDWPLVVRVISEMPESLKSQARWRYWLARAQQQMRNDSSFRALYEALVATDDNYFAAMAAARLGVRYVPHLQSLVVDSSATRQLAAQPVMQRMHELISVNLRAQASAEWNAVASTWSPEQQLAVMRLISDWGWYEQVVAVTARMGQYNDYELLYPQPYDPAVTAAARLTGLTADLIYAQMRQESLFRADAVSSANARGLLQLLPTTARSTARQFKLPVPADEDLFNPQVNVPLGAAHLKSLVDAFNGQTLLALAAYNAGSTAARRWLPARPMDSDIWMENIPYNETRTYVQRIMWHSLVFHWLRNREPLDTKAWLAQVSPDRG